MDGVMMMTTTECYQAPVRVHLELFVVSGFGKNVTVHHNSVRVTDHTVLVIRNLSRNGDGVLIPGSVRQ